jgi:hypothetical protein
VSDVYRSVVATGDRITMAGTGEAPPGTRMVQQPAEFELSRDVPGPHPVYYRIGSGRLDCGDDLAEVATRAGAADVDAGALLALIHGLPEAPDSSGVPGVHRLTVGTTLRVDSGGVRVLRRPASVGRGGRLRPAVLDALGGLPRGYAIAYSGGLASAYLAVCAIAAGHRPTVVHASLGGTRPAPAIPGADLVVVPVDPDEALDPHQVTGAETLPPLPEVALYRHLTATLAGLAGGPMVTGASLTGLLTANLSDIPLGPGGRRLLGCEPFHLSGRLPTLRAARDLIAAQSDGVVRRAAGAPRHRPEDEVQPVGIAPERSTEDGHGDGLPGLTEDGREALRSARLGTSAVWRNHLDGVPAVLGRAEADLRQRGDQRPGDPQVVQPALHQAVLAAIDALPNRRLAVIRGGLVRNQWPLRSTVHRHGVRSVLEHSSLFQARLAAARYLDRTREKVAADLGRECALADLGLLDPSPLLTLLDDGRLTADRALVILRLVWINRWLLNR